MRNVSKLFIPAVATAMAMTVALPAQASTASAKPAAAKHVKAAKVHHHKAKIAKASAKKS